MPNNHTLSETEVKKMVELLKNSSHQAFIVLYTRYHDQLINYCKQYLIDKDEAEDIVQDIFLQLWETCDSLNADLSFSGYLHTLTRNKILCRYRQFDVHSRYAQHLIANAKKAANDTEKSIQYNDYEALLSTFIESLSPKQKEIFKLSRIEGLTYKEISELLDITVPTVQTHAYLALKKIKNFLKQHEVIHFQNVTALLIFFLIFF